ncbi:MULTISPECIES: hypothetical protein [unclassified Mesorhizobium]|uniref:hypothetical protein n=1 Tax=unclassified Mesorhizobium TaxID=325217 RepID=UPI0020CA0757|nr:hypothetical protein [Mesorhizobium sp. LMG 17147]MCP9231169.1 hypothetical protein [Mesorhizobium sp. LMG 17147]
MTEPGDTLLDRLGRWLAGRLQEESSGYEPYTPSDAIRARKSCHHSLYTPRDFDLSPYFRIVKPTLEYGFDYRQMI